MKESINGSSFEIDGEVMSWVGVGDYWYDCGLDECCDFMKDIVYKCPDLDIKCEADDAGPLADIYYFVSTNNREAAVRFLRSGVARVVRQNMDQIRRRRQEMRDVEAGIHPFGVTVEEQDAIIATVQEVVERLDRSRKTGDLLDGLWVKSWPDGGWGSAPKGAHNLCSWELYVEIEYFRETLSFYRTDTRDAIWSNLDHRTGTVVSRPRQGDPKQAALFLLTVLILSRAGFGWPHQPTGSAMLNSHEVQLLFEEVEKALDARKIDE